MINMPAMTNSWIPAKAGMTVFVGTGFKGCPLDDHSRANGLIVCLNCVQIHGRQIPLVCLFHFMLSCPMTQYVKDFLIDAVDLEQLMTPPKTSREHFGSLSPAAKREIMDRI